MKHAPEELAILLRRLTLTTIAQHYEEMGQEAARDGRSHVDYLRRLAEAEDAARYERSVQRRTRAARLPFIKTLEQFDWIWPKRINRAQVQDLFRLRFIEQHTNVVLIGGVGLGKTHLALALAYSACLHNVSTLFAPAVEIVNALSAAQAANTLSKALKAYAAPRLLVIDELGYLPMDKRGADLLFQVISARYEHSATLITSNMVYKQWPRIFNNDATLTTAILDRLVHHCETVTIEGKSYRTKEET
ncbi:MAG: IS21-like element helper ATPase IstB [Lentisphaeria bacterium]|nr:IS21-like element helper ATPase IstB [Lentisphaeria bacterium]